MSFLDYFLLGFASGLLLATLLAVFIRQRSMDDSIRKSEDRVRESYIFEDIERETRDAEERSRLSKEKHKEKQAFYDSIEYVKFKPKKNG